MAVAARTSFGVGVGSDGGVANERPTQPEPRPQTRSGHTRANVRPIRLLNDGMTKLWDGPRRLLSTGWLRAYLFYRNGTSSTLSNIGKCDSPTRLSPFYRHRMARMDPHSRRTVLLVQFPIPPSVQGVFAVTFLRQRVISNSVRGTTGRTALTRSRSCQPLPQTWCENTRLSERSSSAGRRAAFASCGKIPRDVDYHDAPKPAPKQIRLDNRRRLVVQQILVPASHHQLGHNYGKVPAGVGALQV